MPAGYGAGVTRRSVAGHALCRSRRLINHTHVVLSPALATLKKSVVAGRKGIQVGGNQEKLERAGRARIADLMGRMSEGDREAAFLFYDEFGGRIAGVVLRHARRMGVHHVAPEELNGLVMDVCLLLIPLAGAWRPDGGALPWNWAGNRVLALVAGWVGQFGVEFDSDRHEQAVQEEIAWVEHDLEELELLEEMARTNPQCALLASALAEVATRRDRRILLAYKAQSAAGDPSPARTVGDQFAMKPDAVRQVVARVRRRLRHLSETGEGYSGLDELHILAA
jgi:hypothetical protein